jgi:5-methylcytosine-specific restriction endonuclease McrA
MRDQRSEEAKAYRAWYTSKTWLAIRRQHIQGEPLCRMCAEQDLITPAYAVDHIVDHKGDWSLFTDPSNLQSLCALHHNSTKQREAYRGPRRVTGLDGWPLD